MRHKLEIQLAISMGSSLAQVLVKISESKMVLTMAYLMARCLDLPRESMLVHMRVGSMVCMKESEALREKMWIDKMELSKAHWMVMYLVQKSELLKDPLELLLGNKMDRK